MKTRTNSRASSLVRGRLVPAGSTRNLSAVSASIGINLLRGANLRLFRSCAGRASNLTFCLDRRHQVETDGQTLTAGDDRNRWGMTEPKWPGPASRSRRGARQVVPVVSEIERR